MVLAVDDDHVLRPADDVDIAVGHIAHVAGIEPAVGHARRGGGVVAEIADHYRLALAPDLADRTLGEGRAVLFTDFDRHVAHRLAAIDDRTVALRAVFAARTARQLGFLDQLDTDPLARWHQRYRQRRFGEAVAGQEGGGLEPGIGEGVDERLHHVGTDHVGAIARDAPARQVEPVARLGLRRHAARADVIAEGRRIAERRAGVAADQIEPGERTAREILGLEVIGRDLIGDRRQEAADQPHVVIPGQPGHAAIGVADFHAVAVRSKIVEQSLVRDDDAVREPRRAARILQIGDVVRTCLGQRGGGGFAGREFGPVDPVRARQTRRLARHLRELGREDQHLGIAAGKLDAKLFDIGIAAAERRRQGQRHRPGAGIDDTEEQRGEFWAGLGDQRDAVGRGDAGGDQAIRHRQRVAAQRRIGIGLAERTARVMEVEAALPRRRIVERLAKCREVGEAARQRVRSGGRRALRRHRIGRRCDRRLYQPVRRRRLKGVDRHVRPVFHVAACPRTSAA